MKKISRISIGIFFVLFCLLCIMSIHSESKYKEYDSKAIGLWYEGSIYKSQKKFLEAKESYQQSLAVAHSPTLRKTIE